MATSSSNKKAGNSTQKPPEKTFQRKKANERTARALDTQKTVSRKQKQ